jgi:hypothetical protein
MRRSIHRAAESIAHHPVVKMLVGAAIFVTFVMALISAQVRVSGFGFRGSGLGARVQGFGLGGSGSGVRVWGLGFRGSGLGARVLASGLGFRFPVSCSGCRVPYFRVRVSGMSGYNGCNG